MSTPALNPLVEKVRAANPGAYDDMDDATLTNKVLAKYPQYSDLAAPKVQNPVKVESPDSPLDQGLTTFGAKLEEAPSAIGKAVLAKHWPIIDSKNFSELGDDIKSLNPIATDEGNLPMDIGATAANLLPAVAAHTRIGEVAGSAADAVPPMVRAGVKGANTLLEKAPGRVGAVVGGAIGEATHIPYAGMGGAAIGGAIGRAVLPKIKIPGENFGISKPVFSKVPLGPENAPSGEFVDTPQQPKVAAPFASATVVNPKMLPAVASGAVRRMPGEIEPEAVGAPDASTLAGRKGVVVAKPSAPTPKGLMLSGEVTKPTSAPPKPIGDLLNEGLGGKALKPNVPLRDQLSNSPTKIGVSPGHTPVESSAIKSYKYDPATKEFETVTNTGAVYVHGDVSPEQVKAFENADSKGKAWNDIKNNSTYVGKVVNGKRVAAKPIIGRSASPTDVPPPSAGDLTDVLKRSVASAKRPKSISRTAQQ